AARSPDLYGPPPLDHARDVLAVAGAADQRHDPLRTMQVRQRQQPAVPQHEDHRLPPTSERFERLAPLHLVPRARHERVEEDAADTAEHAFARRLDLHPLRSSSSAASATTRSAVLAPLPSGTVSEARTWPNASTMARRSGPSLRSGRRAPARAAGSASSCRNSGATRRPATRFARPMWSTLTSRFANQNVTGCVRYAITMGTPASAACNVVVPDFTSAARACARSSADLRTTGNGAPAYAAASRLSAAAITGCTPGCPSIARSAASVNTVRWRSTSCARDPGN